MEPVIRTYGLTNYYGRRTALRGVDLEVPGGVVFGHLGPNGAGKRPGSPRVVASAFDTRINRPRLPGSTARAAGRRLRRLRFGIAAPPESFYVTDTTDPLVPGEADRAIRWATRLGSTVASPSGPTKR